MRRLVAAAVAGMLVAASLPPWSIWPAAPLGMSALVTAIASQRWTRRALLGGVAGVVWFAITLRWVATFTGPGVVVLVLLQAAFPAVAAALTPPGPGRLVAFPGAVVLVEMLRYRWPLGGLPLSGIALGQVDGPWAGLAAMTGPHGILLLVVVTASLAAGGVGAVLARRRGPAFVTLVAAAGVLLVPLVVPTGIGTVPAGPELDVAAVQGGGGRGIPAVRADPDAVFRRHLDTAAAAGAGLDLLLWPEDTVDVDGRFAGSPQRDALARLARDLDATVVAGVVEDAEGSSQQVRRFRNAAVVIAPDGRIVARYDKVLRVPFGEYVPWRPLIARIADLSLIPRDAVAGEGPGLLATPVGDLGVAISFEGLFPERARAAVDAGGQVLLLPTNASSYVTDDVPSQELAAARLRAVETGRAVVMAAPTGYTAVIDADGAVQARSQLEAATLVRGTVIPRSGRTPYGRVGDAPTGVASAGLLAVGWWLARGGRVSRPRCSPP